MNNVATTMRAQGDLDGARKAHEKPWPFSDACWERSIRTRSTPMNNLGTTLRVQGDPDGARKLHEETLAIRRRVLGAEAPGYYNLRLEPVPRS